MDVLNYRGAQLVKPRVYILGWLSLGCAFLVLTNWAALFVNLYYTRQGELMEFISCVGILLATLGIVRSRMRSPLSWIGLLLNVPLAGLVGLGLLMGAGQS